MTDPKLQVLSPELRMLTLGSWVLELVVIPLGARWNRCERVALDGTGPMMLRGLNEDSRYSA
jgi:hypothetical protein